MGNNNINICRFCGKELEVPRDGSPHLCNPDPIHDSAAYLERMGVTPDAGSIAREIVRYISTGSEDDYYAVKYGRRMIEALIEIKLKEKGAI